jgi:hypothetical protein
MAEKTETSYYDNPVFTFFRSMLQTVVLFPTNIIAETIVKIFQLLAEMEAKSLYEQRRPTALGFLFHSSSSSSDHKVPCYSGHGHVPLAPSRSAAQMLSSPCATNDSFSHLSPSEPTPTPAPP